MTSLVLRWGRTLLNTERRDLLRSSAVVLVVGMLGNVANYLYQFAMGRLLTLADFGALNAILSLTIIISVPAATITLVKAKHIARMARRESWGQIRALYYSVLKKTAFFSGAAAATVVLMFSPLQRFLNLEQFWPLMLFAVLVFWSLLAALNIGFYQGLQRFAVYAGLGTILGGIRLVAAVLLVWAGAALVGALSAAILATAAVFILSFLLIRSLLRPYPDENGEKPESLQFSSTSATLFFLTLITFIDMVLVKHRFNPEQAGIYAGVCVLGRTILYLPAAVAQVLLPKVSGAERAESFRLFVFSTVLTAGISLAGVIFFYAFPEPLLRLFLGGQYQGGAAFLGPYGLAMVCFAIMTLSVNYCLARDIQDTYKVLAFVSLFQVGSLYFWSRNIPDVLFYMTVTGLMACVLLLVRIVHATRSAAIAASRDHYSR
ncbi:MAG: oligosaccharide flippase family protein [Acidobacteria bacterium]|nr:oligosaccharide flippase family protein [Acidobacteriota bacterium]